MYFVCLHPCVLFHGLHHFAWVELCDPFFFGSGYLCHQYTHKQLHVIPAILKHSFVSSLVSSNFPGLPRSPGPCGWCSMTSRKWGFQKYFSWTNQPATGLGKPLAVTAGPATTWRVNDHLGLGKRRKSARRGTGCGRSFIWVWELDICHCKYHLSQAMKSMKCLGVASFQTKLSKRWLFPLNRNWFTAVSYNVSDGHVFFSRWKQVPKWNPAGMDWIYSLASPLALKFLSHTRMMTSMSGFAQIAVFFFFRKQGVLSANSFQGNVWSYQMCLMLAKWWFVFKVAEIP